MEYLSPTLVTPWWIGQKSGVEHVWWQSSIQDRAGLHDHCLQACHPTSLPSALPASEGPGRSCIVRLTELYPCDRKWTEKVYHPYGAAARVILQEMTGNQRWLCHSILNQLSTRSANKWHRVIALTELSNPIWERRTWLGDQTPHFTSGKANSCL